MSTTDDSVAIRDPSREALARLGTIARSLRAGLVGLSFWIAVLGPFIQLLVLATGINGRSDFVLLGGLVAVNAIALVVGNNHRAGRPNPRH